MSSFKNKNIMITGASSGIGYNLSKFFFKKNANLILISKDKSKKHLYRLISNKINPIFFDLKDFSNYEKLFLKINKTYGKIDHLIHSAGIHLIKPVKALTIEDINSSIDLNLKSSIYLSRFIGDNKFFSRPSSSVFVSSVMGVVGEPGQVLYSASKSGIYGLTRSLAIELARYKIRINCISPGIIDSPLFDNYSSKITQDNNKKFIDKHPLGIGQYSDLNNLVEYLLSNKSKWVTGQNHIIDGGYSSN